jgi:ZIP family zinc transporter
MLYVSFVEILPKATAALSTHYGPASGGWFANLGFFGGIAVMALIDWLVPSADNPHELRGDEELRLLKASRPPLALGADGNSRLRRMGLFTAAAIAIHNFPEGMATFLAAIDDPRTGVAIAIAVALHNIPEGISVSVPVFYATGHRGKAFLLSLSSGLAEPIGGAAAGLALDWFLPLHAAGFVFAGVAGIMVYVSIDELLPTAHEYGHSHEVLAGIAAGMALMAVSLLLLR